MCVLLILHVLDQDETPFRFEIIHRSKRSRAKVGRIHTPHGIIDTPTFVPVGTNATIKSVDMKTIAQTDFQLMFCNTLHLMLHPGADVIAQAGGLHKFMGHDRPIITDSGGFQVFSLGQRDDSNVELKGKSKKSWETSVLKLTEEGVLFRSYRDGATFYLTPESSIQSQKAFGSDIMIPLDELPAYNVSREKLEESLHRTHRWEERSLNEHLKNPNGQAMYSVIHGGIDPDLRTTSIDFLTKLPFDGHAIGGSVGKDRTESIPLVDFVMQRLPNDKPVHLLGIGDLPSINQCVLLGVDSFDSAFPTRLGRHGNLLISTDGDQIDVGHVSNKYNFDPIDPKCGCHTCRHYSRSYLHHLMKSHEQSGHILGTMHNLHFMVQHMKNIREAILQDLI